MIVVGSVLGTLMVEELGAEVIVIVIVLCWFLDRANAGNEEKGERKRQKRRED